MSERPFMKFYPSDYRGDPRLRMCSLAARGLWMEMIALMHEADPYGHLLVSGIAPTDTQLAVLAGALPDQIPGLLGELESAGVFSRTQKGVIFSRRMTRDEKKARIAKKNGKSGGNPTLRKQRGNPASDNPPDKPPDKPHIPESRVQSPEDASSLRSDASGSLASLALCPQAVKRDTADVETLPAELVDEAFVQFWQAYPHPPNRGSRARAEALFAKLSQPDRLAVIASLGPLRDYCAAAGWYTPKMAQTYLNPKNRHWEETPDAAAERNRSAARAGGAEDIFSLLGGDRRA